MDVAENEAFAQNDVRIRHHRLERMSRRLNSLSNIMRVVTLLGIIIYAVLVQSQASSTHNWESTRTMGLLDTEHYNLESKVFVVEEINISNTSTEVLRPILTQKDSGAICLTDEHLATCRSTLLSIDTGDSIAEFTTNFSRTARSYFPYSTFINVISFVCLVLTLLYEFADGATATAAEGQFATNVDKRLVIRINGLLTVTIALMLIVAATFQTFVFVETCKGTYLPQGDSFCQDISSCGLTVASVINPGDSTIRSYSALMLLFCAVLSLSLMLRCAGMSWKGGRIEPMEEDDDDMPAHRTRVNPNGLDAIEFFFARLRAPRIAIDEQAKELLPWKLLTGKDLRDLDDCPICLNALCRHALQPSASGPTIVSRHHVETAPEHGHREEDAMDTDTVHTRGSQSVRGRVVSPDIEAASRLGAADAEDAEEDAGNGTNGDAVRVVCQHVFHETCIREWLVSHNNCPVCRTDLARGGQQHDDELPV